MSRECLLLMSDTHAGSEVGLCNPATKIFDKRAGRVPGSFCHPILSFTQERLWNAYDQHLRHAAERIDGDPVTIIHLGDPTDGNVHVENTDTAHFLPQYQMAKWNMYHAYDVLGTVKAILFLEGTGVHTYGGNIEYVLADLLREKYNVPVWCYQHLVLTVGETTHDLAHHGPRPGRWVHTKTDPPARWLKNYVIKSLIDHQAPVTCTYRGHWHQYLPPITYRHPVEYLDSHVEVVESTYCQVPGYSGMTDYAVKATQSGSSIIWGMLLVEIFDGRSVNVTNYGYPFDTRIREEI